MKRLRHPIFCWLYVVLLFASFFTGCSHVNEKTGQKPGLAGENALIGSNPGKINIQFAHWSIPSARLSENVINKFNETNKNNIYIEELKIPMERYIETLNMLNASGKGPDVFEIIREWLDSYVAKGWAADMTKSVDNDFLSDFPKWAVDYARTFEDSSGRVFSFPSVQITYRLIYNKDLFSEAGLDPENPPRTLSDIENYALKISNAEVGKRKYGIALPMGEEWMDFVMPMEASNCYSGVYFYDFREGKYDLTVYEPWLAAIRNMNENGGLFPGSDTMKISQAIAQFADGNIGMMYVSSWEASLLFDQFPPICDWGVTLPPAIDEASIGRGAVKIDTAGWNVVNSGTKYMDESAKVWKFLYSYDYLADLSDNGLVIPLMNDISPDSGVRKDIARLSEFLPGRYDSVYPGTPLNMEEWTRKDIYRSALSGNHNGQELLEESNRLNTLLDINANNGLININDYRYPDFDSLKPVKQLK
jgi:multiple sugar transport system substrate-binding protein